MILRALPASWKVRKAAASARVIAFAALVSALAALPPPPAAAVTLTVSDVPGIPAGTACVTVTLQSETAAVVGASTDITYPADRLETFPAGDCALSEEGRRGGFELECSQRGANELRCGIFHFALVPLPEGDLFACCFRVGAGDAVGELALTNRCEAVDREGEDLRAACRGGRISVVTATPTVTLAPSAPPTATVSQTRTATATVSPILTPTETPTAEPTATRVATCAGDCDGDGAVMVDELILAVNIALASRSIEQCRSLDLDDSQTISIDELVSAVSHALRGCD